MKTAVKHNSSDKNLRLGITFLVLLFLILWGVHSLTSPKPSEEISVDNAYGLQIVNDILPEASPLRTNELRRIKYIIIHETGNPAATADASSHSYYLHTGGDGSTAWHYTVDENIAYRHIPDNEIAYHAGKGNQGGIGIELCINNGGDFDKTFQNGARLAAKLIDTYNLPVESIRQHADFMDKNCPENIRNNQQWDVFISLVKKYLKEN